MAGSRDRIVPRSAALRGIVVLLVVLALAGCRRHGSDHPPVVPAAGPASTVDPRLDPDARGTERDVPVPADSPELSSACQTYQLCCMALATAMGKTPDMPSESVEAMKQACTAISALGQEQSASESCAMALDAMKQTVDAMKAFPGFIAPAECL